MRAADFAAVTPGAVRRGDEYVALCPGHDDRNPSLSFRDGRHGIILHCFASCPTERILAPLNLQVRDLLFDGESFPRANGQGEAGRIVATYEYRDEVGGVLYRVLRYCPKGFRQQRPDGNGGWDWKLNGVRRVCYPLPELQGAPRVFVVEGEKDVDRLSKEGIPATCNSGGAGKWTDDHTAQLVAAGVHHVVVLADNDGPGHRHAESLKRSCVTAGLSSKIVQLPNLPPKGDVSDFFDAGGTVETLLALVESAPEWETPAPSLAGKEIPPDTRPELDADVGDLDEITAREFDMLSSQNNPPKLFLYGNVPVRLDIGDDGRPRPVELTVDRVRHELARRARWTTEKKSRSGSSTDRINARPPIDIAKNILASSELPFPVLKSIVEVPVVVLDGRIIQRPGFDAESGILYQPFDSHLEISIPGSPTAVEVAKAKALLDEMIEDFAFVGDPDRAHAVAFAIGMFCRDLVDGPTPLHDFEAPSPGTGKNLLVESLLHPAVGYNVGLVPEVSNDDELRKHVTARLRENRPVIVIDNLSRPLDSGVLSAALTSRRWDDRLLGKSETISLPVRTMWALTANNPFLSMEIARRCVRIRLDARTDRPWLRERFRHHDLRRWVKEHRADLICSILTLVRAWLNAGRPAPNVKSLGSYESWSQVVGGIVSFAGYPGFLGNTLELYESADTEGRAWRIFIEQWWASHQDRPVSVSDLLALALKVDGLYLGKKENERGQKTSLGRQLKKRRDQVISAYRIEDAGTRGGSPHWRLQSTAELQLMAQEPVEEIDLRET